MRYLNKIIFINSAHIKYAEINLNGNIHFIGANGFGKSTLLRAILFFYNADTQGLGISKSNDSYVDYYFKNSNSYIIYEIVREEGKFCVASYKSQHRVCFRFFDGEFKQSYFIYENGRVPDNWDSIAQQLDRNKVFYTKRRIEKYEEYRDIIYGNHEGKKSELKNYSISESKDYQQVPKTIQNVFLNSKMDAEFIKQIIILSLDNNILISLTKYTYHLNDFETQLMDIDSFKKSSTKLLTENISKLHIEIEHFENEKIQLTKELAYAIKENERKEPKLIEKLKNQQEQEISIKEKSAHAKELFDEKFKQINGKICVQDENLKKAREYKEYYEKKNINEIIVKVDKKKDLKKELEHLQTEKKILSERFSDIEIKYKMLYDTIKNQYQDFLNMKKSQKYEINSAFLSFKENIEEKISEQISVLKEEQKIQSDNLKSAIEKRWQIVNDLKSERSEIKYMHFFENDIVELKNTIQKLENSINQTPIEIQNLSEVIKNIRKQWELDEQNLQKSFELNKNIIENQIINIKKQVDEIEMYINNSKISLHGWLTKNYPNWEKTIGKVIDDKNVLFNSSLCPKLLEMNNNFYGIEIDLDKIDKTVKTIDDYEIEKLELNEQIQSLKQSFSELDIKFKEDNEKFKNKYHQKIKETEKNISEKEYFLESSKKLLIDKTIRLNDLKNRADTERNNKLKIIENKIGEATENLNEMKRNLKNLEEAHNKIISSKEKEQNEILTDEKTKINISIDNIDLEIGIKKTEFERQKEDVYKQKNRELLLKGVDTERLGKLEIRLRELNEDLEYIEDNRDLVAEYKGHKRDFIDSVNEFKQEKQKNEELLKLEQSKYDIQYSELNKKLVEIQSFIVELKEEIKTILDDSKKFTEFRSTENFKSIEIYFLDSTKLQKTERQVGTLIDEIKSIHYDKLQGRKNELRINSNNFLGKFSENNILKFPKQLANDENILLDFAKELSDFVKEQKIKQLEKEVNERFATVVSTIGTETGNLMAKSNEIQSIIRRINSDFVEKNFIGVGVIKRIELKVEDSQNEIFQLLLEIKRYSDENSIELGSANIFTSDDSEKKNKKAIDLLKQFVKKINELKKDEISLSDSFELKFRIEENQNDTGWVEKLSNVGSEGTDTLVKAMVNIMLLNVFKEKVSKKFKDFNLHCMMDEIGKLHPNNVRGILKFANERNIWLINSSPTENDALAFTRIYKLQKEANGIIKVKRIITQYTDI